MTVMVGFTAITCDNLTDGETGSIPYTVNSDGTTPLPILRAIFSPPASSPASAFPSFPRITL